MLLLRSKATRSEWWIGIGDREALRDGWRGYGSFLGRARSEGARFVIRLPAAVLWWCGGVVVCDRDLPFRSEAGEEGEQGVCGPVAAGLDVEGPSTFQRPFLDGQVAVEVDAGGGRDVLVTEP